MLPSNSRNNVFSPQVGVNSPPPDIKNLTIRQKKKDDESWEWLNN